VPAQRRAYKPQPAMPELFGMSTRFAMTFPESRRHEVGPSHVNCRRQGFRRGKAGPFSKARLKLIRATIRPPAARILARLRREFDAKDAVCSRWRPPGFLLHDSHFNAYYLTAVLDRRCGSAREGTCARPRSSTRFAPSVHRRPTATARAPPCTRAGPRAGSDARARGAKRCPYEIDLAACRRLGPLSGVLSV